MTLLEKIAQSRHLTKANAAVKRLMSGPGEANSSSMAQDVIQHYQALDETGRATFYTSLAENFNPDPKAVAQAALTYAEKPEARNLIAVFKYKCITNFSDVVVADIFCKVQYFTNVFAF